MATDPSDLPSTIEETLSACPRFRILVVGNTGVGKSSLVSSIFNVDIKDDIDIAHDRAGVADINREYTADSNPRFILHDSKGSEPGSTDNWKLVSDFIRVRCDEGLPSKDRLHAIWLCIETPRTGMRFLQTADEELLKVANELKVTVIIVCTKYDLLVKEQFLEARKARSTNAKQIAEINAETRLKKLFDDFELRFDYVAVSTDKKYSKRFDMLKKLTETTRTRLHHFAGDLWVPWATAQQVNAQQKVKLSIDEGFKKYWIDLGKSSAFPGKTLWECISRIHLDVIEAWNFHDPDNLLSGTGFSKEMVKLIEPLLTEPQPFNMGEMLANLSDLASVAGVVIASFAQVLSGAGVAVIAIKFLFHKYQAIPITALCLGAYIVDLTLILYDLFETTLTMEPPRPLTETLVMDAYRGYKDIKAADVHKHICEIPLGIDPKDKIAELIRRQLKFD